MPKMPVSISSDVKQEDIVKKTQKTHSETMLHAGVQNFVVAVETLTQLRKKR